MLPDMKDLIERAIAAAGTQVALAEKCRVTQPGVANWLARGKCPKWHLRTLEAIVKRAEGRK